MESLGRHVIAELYDCDASKIDDVMLVQQVMEEASIEAGATIINTTFHHFAPYGVSGVVVIQESHLSIHTWPEYGFASVDIFTCGEAVNPWTAAEVMAEKLGASHHSAVEMRRGQKAQLNRKPEFAIADTYQIETDEPEVKRNIWFTERTENYALSVKHQGELLFRKKSEYQRIEVYQTDAFGRMLVLDGVIVLTEKDGFVYHEMITHVPAISTNKVENVLVLGGGDGAVVKELLKHPQISTITVLEIDNEITEVSKRFFPDLNAAFHSDKVNYMNGDVNDLISDLKAESFDLIIDDLHSPVEAKSPKDENTFLEKISSLLTQQGLLVTSLGAPNLNKEYFTIAYKKLQKHFGERGLACYQANIPTFPTGMWVFAICAKKSLGEILVEVNKPAQEDLIQQNGFQYYSSEMHQAAFALPVYVKDMMQ
ncbi:MAG: spermidine synthase [Thalassobius sp.]|nr:spermidine synthase [Thalassovita sp.]